jgi:hypothetical protein
MDQTTASPSAMALILVATIITSLAMFRFLPTLVFVVSQGCGKNRVIKLNAVGTTYIAAWIAMASAVIGAGAGATEPFFFSAEIVAMQNVLSGITIICLAL